MMVAERILQEPIAPEQWMAGVEVCSGVIPGYTRPIPATLFGDSYGNSIPSLQELRPVLIDLFSETDLKDLCFDMDIDYEDLQGHSKRDKARELIKYCRNRGRFPELFEKCCELRPHAFARGKDVSFTGSNILQMILSPDSSHLLVSNISELLINTNTQFVNREKELQDLADTLEVGQDLSHPRQVVVVVGPDGFGKARISREFLRKHQQHFAEQTVWIDFSGVDEDQIKEKIIAFLEPISGLNNLPIDRKVELVRQGWDRLSSGFFIFENCENAQLLQSFLPSCGRILITSCEGGWTTSGVGKEIRLKPLPREDSVRLLQAFRSDLSSAEADTLAKELDDVPLALNLAGKYLARYRNNTIGKPDKFLAELHYRQEKHPALTNIEQLFTLRYSQLDINSRLDAVACRLLLRATYFAHGEFIPRDLLEHTNVLDSDQPEDRKYREWRLTANATHRLEDLGLLIQSRDEKAVRLQRLLVDFVRRNASQEERVAAQRAVEHVLIQAIRKLSEDPDTSYKAINTLQPHLRAVTDVAKERSDLDAASLCNILGFNLLELGNYKEAYIYFQRAYEIQRQLSEAPHPDIAASLTNLAEALWPLGEYTQARQYVEQALTILQESTHPDSGAGLTSLAKMLWHLGDYKQSYQYAKRSLVALETKGDVDHRHKANSLNILALSMMEQGELADALGCATQAFEIREKHLPKDHPAIASSLYILAQIHYLQGDYTQAEEYCRRELSLEQSIYGQNHVKTATGLNNLGLMLFMQGKYEEALRLYEQAIRIRRQYLNNRHPSLVEPLNNLGLLQSEQKDHIAALSSYEEALSIAREIFGDRHHLVAKIYNNLGALLRYQGEFKAALKYHKRAVGVCGTCLESDHIEVGRSYYHLGVSYHSLANFKQAVNALRHALPIYQKVYGKDHVTTLRLQEDLLGDEDLERSRLTRIFVTIIFFVIRPFIAYHNKHETKRSSAKSTD